MAEGITNLTSFQLKNTGTTDPANNGEIRYVTGTGFRFKQEGTVHTFQTSGGGGGDITSVVAGAGLTGGGITGDVTLNVANTDGKITVGANSIDITADSLVNADINTAAAIAWSKMAVSTDISTTGTVVDLTLTGEANGYVPRFNGTNWVAVDPATLPGGVATGLSQAFNIEGGANDIVVTTTSQTVGAGALTIPDFAGVADTFVFTTLAQTLTAKTLTSPDINGGTADSLTNFSIRSSGAAFDLEQDTSEVLTGNKVISWTVNDTNRAIDLGGDLTLANNFTTSGNFALTLTQTGGTNVTLPTTGTLATLAGTEVFENKSLEATCALVDTADNTKKILWDLTGATADKDITLTGVQTDDRAITLPDADCTLVGKDTTDVLTNKTIDCDGTGNVLSNVNANELDPITMGASTYGVPFVVTYNLTNQGAAVNVFNANCPFKLRVIDAYSVSTSADGGTWKLNNGAAGAGTDLNSAVTVAASDNDIDRMVDLDDSAWEIAANGSLSIVPDVGGALDCMIFITCIRVD